MCDSAHPCRVESLLGAAMFLPREVFFRCGPWDEGYMFGVEDLDLCTRISQEYDVVYLPSVEITHLGRVSSRQHIGFAFSQMMSGFPRFLRNTGSTPAELVLYKLIVTLDAPLQIVGNGLQYLWRRLRGQSTKAQKSLIAWQGSWDFFSHGLVHFWRG
jgi:GT2 family glycosyltransferase